MRKPVVKIDCYGKRIQVYPSVRAAAEENYMATRSVLRRCQRRVQKEMADGFTFRYLGDENIGEVAKRKATNWMYCRVCGKETGCRRAKYCYDCRKRITIEGAAAGNVGYRIMMRWYE